MSGAQPSLHDILLRAPRFWIENPSLNNLKMDDIATIVDELLLYLSFLIESLPPFFSKEIDWYLHNKSEISSLSKNVSTIDTFLTNLLNYLDTQVLIDESLLLNVDKLTDALLQVKKFTITYKKYLAISLINNEINDEIIKSLNQEIDSCFDTFENLLSFQSSTTRPTPSFDLSIIVSKLRDNLVELPTFNEYDAHLYQGYILLQSTISPLKFSLSILPLKVDELNKMCSGGLFPTPRGVIINNYEKLLERWDVLLNKLQKLKIEVYDHKWDEIFNYLIDELLIKCDSLLLISSIDDDDDEITSNYRLCSTLINIIHYSIRDQTIYNKDIINSYSGKLLPKWNKVNQMFDSLNPKEIYSPPMPSLNSPKRVNGFTQSKSPRKFNVNNKLNSPSQIIGSNSNSPRRVIDFTQVDSSKSSIDHNGLKTFNTKRNSQANLSDITKRNSLTDAPSSANGFGFDLGVNVKSVLQNYSIKKVDKIQDIFGNFPPSLPSSKDLRHSLQSIVFEDEDGDEDVDMSILVTKPSNQVIDTRALEKLMEKLLVQTRVSKLPKISIDYFEQGLPPIKKVGLATLIPRINVDHFSQKSQELRDVPNLQYEDVTMSFNSTSPERPSTPMGSRFDDIHLVQPYKSKVNWRG